MSKFEAPYSYINGILHTELADTILQKLYGIFSKSVDENEFKKNPIDPMELVQRGRDAVLTAEKCFKHEDPKSQDFCLKMKVADLRVSLLNFA